MRARVFSCAIVALLTVGAPACAQELASRWDGWWVGGFASNPLNTFEAVHETVPLTSHRVTGSMVGITAGRGFQFGFFYFGANVAAAGGHLEGQSSACPGNCYTSLLGLGEATLSAGIATQWVMLRVGLGPSFGVMQAGQTATGLHTMTVSGWHTKAGLEVALTSAWSVYGEYQHQRLGDLYYNTPAGSVGVDTRDHQAVRLGINYRFGR